MKVTLFLLLAGCLLSGVVGEWLRAGLPPSQATLRVTFAIKQTNPQWLEEKLRSVSYPNSPHYGQYMNFDEIAEHVHGKGESVKAVVDALDSVGVLASSVDFTLGRDFAVAELPIEKAQELFSAVFYNFKNADCPEVEGVISSESFALPASLKGHVDFVSGIQTLPAACPRKRKMQFFNSTVRAGRLEVTPKTIAEDYNTSGYKSTNSANSQAVASFLKQYYDPTDLKKFQERFDIPVKPIAKVVGKNLPDDPGAEANLDVQYISATGQGVDTWFVSTSTYSNGKQEDFLSWILLQVNSTDSPWVHSASYGDQEHTIDEDYLTRVNNEFMKFGISGRTVLFASGDNGVHCHRKGIRKVYMPDWPSSSPYITSVGGTESTTRVWSMGGGGFSNFFATPDYQKTAVDDYVKTLSNTDMFNKSGRAYPDVSAFATDFTIIDDGVPMPVDGTSCAAPTFAGIVSILNDVRLNKGQKTLGFLNPLLYQTLKGQGFNDITEGNNGAIACKGFDAAKGWDPASGWGSPNFGALKGLI